MDAPVTVIAANPAGESKNTDSYPLGSWPVDTPGGRYYVEWDDQAPVTREGQLIFLFQFLHVGGRWEEFLPGREQRQPSARKRWMDLRFQSGDMPLKYSKTLSASTSRVAARGGMQHAFCGYRATIRCTAEISESTSFGFRN